jgi:hypothetical protein
MTYQSGANTHDKIGTRLGSVATMGNSAGSKIGIDYL